MRDALSLLDQCAASGAGLILNRVREVLGLAAARNLKCKAIGRGEACRPSRSLPGSTPPKSIESVLDRFQIFSGTCS